LENSVHSVLLAMSRILPSQTSMSTRQSGDAIMTRCCCCECTVLEFLHLLLFLKTKN